MIKITYHPLSGRMRTGINKENSVQHQPCYFAFGLYSYDHTIMKFKPGTVITLVSLSITLFLIGFYLLIVVHLSKLEELVDEKTPFLIELKDNLAQPDRFLLIQQLKEREYVQPSSVRFISRDDGLKMLEEQFGNQLLSDSTGNPLRDVISLKLQSAFIRSGGAGQLIGDLEKHPAVENCYFEQQQTGQLRNNLARLNRVLLITGLLFVVISVLLIYNNLKLVLRADRFMLKTMELVGASPSFIKLPYIKKSLQIGFLAGIINLLLFSVLLVYLNTQFDVFEHFFDLSLTLFVLVILFFIGLFFPLVFSNILVNKFIRMPENKRYQ